MSGVLGTAKDWAGVIDNQAPNILRLLKAAWKRVPVGPLDEREDDITNRLVVALQRSRRARKMMFYIHPQPVELDPATGDEYGRMDIAFYPSNQPWVPREDIYFCIECKRLNVIKNGAPRSYASEYVTLGMARFVTGQYSRAVQHGCMVGYVRDGDVRGAMGNVEQNIQQRYKELGMNAPGSFRASDVFPRTASARETHHRRTQRGAPFRLHHLFMEGDPNAVVTVRRAMPKRRRGRKWAWRRRK
jgi:hypothetical protein